MVGGAVYQQAESGEIKGFTKFVYLFNQLVEVETNY